MADPVKIRAGRLGGLSTVARHGGMAAVRRMDAAAWQRWLDAVDPDRTLDEDDRNQRARAARRAHICDPFGGPF